MNLSFRVTIKINDEFSLPLNSTGGGYKYGTGNSSRPEMIVSLDDSFQCIPWVDVLESNNHSVDINLRAVLVDNAHSRYALKELIASDIKGLLMKKYSSIGYVTKRIPKDSFLVVKIFTPSYNDTDQVCEVIKCGAILSLEKLRKEKNVQERMYIHKMSTSFGTISVQLKEISLDSGTVFGGPRLNQLAKMNIGSTMRSTLSTHIKISKAFDEKVNIFLSQFDFNLIFKSERIRCHYNFSTFGNFLPMSFVISNSYTSNVPYWVNLYKLCLIDVLLKFQIVTFKDIRSVSISQLDRKYWKNLPEKLKYIVLVQMFRIVPNSIPYISDFVSYNAKERYPNENFNPCALFNKSADCEDYGSISRMMFNAFKQCDISKVKMWNNNSDGGKGTGIYELWIMAKLFIDSITLYRVTTAAVREPINKMKSGITAHMNLMLTPKNIFFKNITLDSIWNSSSKNNENVEKLGKSIELEISKFKKHVNELSSIRGVSVKSILKTLSPMVVEGTGPLCTFIMTPANLKTREYVKTLLIGVPLAQMEIYHTSETKSVFFTHAMLGLCDLTRFGINSDGWVYSQSYKKSFTTGESKSYGCKFKDLMNNRGVSFILRPFMSPAELKSAYFTSKLQISSPRFNVYDQGDNSNIGDWKTINHVNDKGARNFKFEPIMYRQVGFNEKYQKLKKLKSKISALCDTVNNAIQDNVKKVFTDNSHNVVVRLRVEDFMSSVKQLTFALGNSKYVISMHYYFEDIFIDITNLVLVLRVSY